MKPARKASTRNVEMVETDRIVRALRALSSVRGFHARERALYHAILISGFLERSQEQALRETLRLP